MRKRDYDVVVEILPRIIVKHPIYSYEGALFKKPTRTHVWEIKESMRD
jgi:hypothetical protein